MIYFTLISDFSDLLWKFRTCKVLVHLNQNLNDGGKCVEYITELNCPYDKDIRN